MDWEAIAALVAVPTAAAGFLWWVKWSVKAITRQVVEALDDALGLDDLRDNLNPGPAGWPNGSDTLPEALGEIYRRQDETQRALEQLITDGRDAH